MTSDHSSAVLAILQNHDSDLLGEWMKQQLSACAHRRDLIKESELRAQCQEFLNALRGALQQTTSSDIMSTEWASIREVLTGLSRTRAKQGFSPSETASFVFSLKHPLFARLRQQLGNDSVALSDATWNASMILDKLGLWTVESYQKGREEIIIRQQQEMLELSTPVVELWDGILALPLIGTLDSNRTQVVMESLLERIVETGAEIAVIDITGVPTVDTLVAQHLLKTVAAARLMGADCIISGIRPQIAQTIVHLGVELSDVATKATLASAFELALERSGLTVTKAQSSS